MSQFTFENAIEKLGRILAAQYNIQVLFEGNQAYTDGKKIVLPYFKDMKDELKADLNGYLDHEVGHCKFTQFEEVKKVINRFHKELLNATEDSRIEREMIREFPGTAFHLVPLNDKLRVLMNEGWDKLPWPIRTIVAIRDLMDGRAPRIDADIERYVDAVRDAAIELRECQDTKSIRVQTEAIIKKIIDERDEEKKEEEKKDEEEGEEGDGEGKKSDGKGKGKAKGDSDTDGAPGEGEAEGESSPGSDSDSIGDDGRDAPPKSAEHDKMLSEPVSKKDSEFDKHVTDVHGMINDEIKDHIDTSPVRPSHRDRPSDPKWQDSPSIPATTRFDKVTDHTGKGSVTEYAKLKREVMPLVAPIKSALERVLKVRENAKWSPEKDRGRIDARSLGKMASNKGYRTVFKEFTKTETNNVAVEILVDMSGSMGGRMRTAKMAVVAMAEALRDLQIPFEVTGFFSEGDNKVAEFTRTLGDTARFNRTYERLDLHVFKGFDSPTLSGIEKMFVGSQNPDGECVAWAAKRLAVRREKRKILLVLSDGEPATGDSNRAILCSDLKNKIKAIGKSGIECIGIGIQTECVKNFYPDYIVLNDVAELPKQAMGKLSKLIAGGV
jgi:cobalamin biosynthesis protein CobT